MGGEVLDNTQYCQSSQSVGAFKTEEDEKAVSVVGSDAVSAAV
jgi:hypothetical protein